MSTQSSSRPSAQPLGAQTARRRPWRRYGRNALIAAVVLLLAIQLIPYGHSHVNPAVAAEPAWNSPRTRELFFRACADCHSNETTWPWYSNVAPGSWLIVHDVQDGRRSLDVSEWGRARNKGDEAAEQVQKGKMPPWYYTILHPYAQLSPAERQELIAGLVATFGERREGGESGGDKD